MSTFSTTLLHPQATALEQQFAAAQGELTALRQQLSEAANKAQAQNSELESLRHKGVYTRRSPLCGALSRHGRWPAHHYMLCACAAHRCALLP